jgi:hypothetical protein
MKFWKAIISSAVVFFAVIGTFIYTSCERDPCQNVTCLNGGSCNGGACRCPSAWEGATCNQKVTDRFVGYYAGFTGCNQGAQIIDTVFIVGNIYKNPTTLRIIQKTHPLDTLFGNVVSTESTYSVVIPDKVANKYNKKYHLTLQSDKTVTLYTYETDARIPGDSINVQCNFLGVKQPGSPW